MRGRRPGTAAPEASGTEVNGTSTVAAAEEGAEPAPEGMWGFNGQFLRNVAHQR